MIGLPIKQLAPMVVIPSFFFLASISILFSQNINLQSSNLPILIINTNGQTILNEPKIVADFEIIYNGPGKLNLWNDTARHFRGKIGLELRGSSSQDLSPKKPLGLETRLADGETNFNVSLLDMPKENDWVLLAPYSDKSLIRDVLIHRIASEIMPYTSRTRLCELVTNGLYMGVYVLMEKIKRDNNRVNIPALTPDISSGESLTGGYILKIDKTSGSTPQGGFNSDYNSGSIIPRRTYYQYEEPEANVINTAQKNYIRTLINNFEASFSKPNVSDPKEGFRKYADVSSMIDFMILNELSNNVDGYRLSTYIYKEPDKKSTTLKFGPIWDFNLAFGNADYCQGGSSEVMAFDFGLRCPNDGFSVPFYWPKVFQDTSFAKSLFKRWMGLRQNLLSDSKVLFLIDSMSTLLNEAAPRNFQRWPILSSYVWPNAYVGGSYANEVKYLKDWLLRRMKYLDGIFYQNTLPKYYPEKYFEPKVFPNPAIDQQDITFSYYIHDYDRMRLDIFDMVGHHLITKRDNDHFNGANQLKSMIVQLPPGLYFYKLFTGESTVFKTGKIIVR